MLFPFIPLNGANDHAHVFRMQNPLIFLISIILYTQFSYLLLLFLVVLLLILSPSPPVQLDMPSVYTYLCSRRYNRFEIVSFGIVEIAQRIFSITAQHLQASIAVLLTQQNHGMKCILFILYCCNSPINCMQYLLNGKVRCVWMDVKRIIIYAKPEKWLQQYKSICHHIAHRIGTHIVDFNAFLRANFSSFGFCFYSGAHLLFKKFVCAVSQAFAIFFVWNDYVENVWITCGIIVKWCHTGRESIFIHPTCAFCLPISAANTFQSS